MFLNIYLLFINSSFFEIPFLNQFEPLQTIKLQSITNPVKKSTCVKEIIYEICDENSNQNGFLPSKCCNVCYFSHALSKIPLKILLMKTKTTLTENDCETETTVIKNYVTDKTYERFKYNQTLIIKKVIYSGDLPYDFVAISNPFIYSKSNEREGIYEFSMTQYQRDLKMFECMFLRFFDSSIDAINFIAYLKNWKSFGSSFKEISCDPLRSKLLSIRYVGSLGPIWKNRSNLKIFKGPPLK